MSIYIAFPQVGYKSPNMEVEGMLRCLRYLKTKVTISEIVTDAATSVISMLCKYCYVLLCTTIHMYTHARIHAAREFPQYYHSLDIWHKSRKLRKCLLEVMHIIMCTWYHNQLLVTTGTLSFMIVLYIRIQVYHHRHLRQREWDCLSCGVTMLSTTFGGAARVAQMMWMYWRWYMMCVHALYAIVHVHTCYNLSCQPAVQRCYGSMHMPLFKKIKSSCSCMLEISILFPDEVD